MPTDVDELVENALLGALLRDPARLDDMLWLTPDDFATGPARDTYTELRRLHDLHAARGGPPPNDYDVHQALLRRWSATTATAVSAGRYQTSREALDRMLHVTPPTADPVAYARIVLEESTRAAIRELGARIGDTPAHDGQQVSTAAATAVERVHQLQRRWQLAAPPAALAAVPAAPAAADRPPGAWLPAARPSAEQACAAERTVMAAAVSGILDPREVADTLHPDEMHAADAALAVAAISVLHADGRPVDAITVAWQQQRLARDRDVTALGWEQLQPPGRIQTAAALDVIRADRAHELAYRAPDTLLRDADRHDQPLRHVLAAAETTLLDLSHAVNGGGLPRLSAAPPRPAPNRPAATQHTPDEPGWRWLAEWIDPRLTQGRDWHPLAAACDRAYAAGYDVAANLPRLAELAPLPDRHPARDLHYRLINECDAAINPLTAAARGGEGPAHRAAGRPAATPVHTLTPGRGRAR